MSRPAYRMIRDIQGLDPRKEFFISELITFMYQTVTSYAFDVSVVNAV